MSNYNNYQNESGRDNYYSELQLAKSEFEAVRAVTTKYSNLKNMTADLDTIINAINKILSRNYSFADEVNLFSDAIDGVDVLYDKIDAALDSLPQ